MMNYIDPKNALNDLKQATINLQQYMEKEATVLAELNKLKAERERACGVALGEISFKTAGEMAMKLAAVVPLHFSQILDLEAKLTLAASEVEQAKRWLKYCEHALHVSMVMTDNLTAMVMENIAAMEQEDEDAGDESSDD